MEVGFADCGVDVVEGETVVEVGSGVVVVVVSEKVEFVDSDVVHGGLAEQFRESDTKLYDASTRG